MAGRMQQRWNGGEGRGGEREGDSERREMQGMIYAAIVALISSKN